MAMIYGSVVVSFLLWLLETARTSKAARAMLWLKRTLFTCFLGRTIAAFIHHENNEELYAKGSYFYKLLDLIWRGFIRVIRFILRPIDRAREKSVIAAMARGSFIFKFESLLVGFVVLIFVIPHEYWNNMYGLAGAIGLMILYILSLGFDKKLSKNVRGLWLSFILFALATVLSVMISHSRGDSFRVFMFFVTSFLLCITVYGTLKDIKRYDSFTTFIFAAVLITSVFGIVQRIVGVAVDASLTDMSLNSGMPGRIYSTLANPNNFAEFLVLFMPFCFAYILNCEKLKKRLWLLALFLLPIAALMFTLSRSGWLSFGVSAIVFAVVYKPKRFPLLVLLVILLLPIMAMVMPSYVINRFMTIGNLRDTSSAYRLEIWSGVLDMLRQYWVTGTGLGPVAFGRVYPNFAQGIAAVAPHSHMLFMEVFAEMGILGFVTFLWLVLSLVSRSITVAGRKISYNVKNYACAAAASASGIMVLGAAEYVWFYPRVMFAFFIAVGMGMAAVRLAKKESGELS